MAEAALVAAWGLVDDKEEEEKAVDEVALEGMEHTVKAACKVDPWPFFTRWIRSHPCNLVGSVATSILRRIHHLILVEDEGQMT
jgi:hypothetical protein